MLKEFKVDTSAWSFVIEGSTGTFQVEVVTTGEKVGEVVFGEDVKLNGRELAMGEGDSVGWSVPETGLSGTVAAQYVASDATRITLDRAGLQELFVAANDGKLVVSASVSAGCQAGDVYTLAVKVADSAGTLVELTHEYTVTEA